MMSDEPKSPDRMIAESTALGVAICGIVAAVIYLLDLKRTLVLAGISYLVWRLYF